MTATHGYCMACDIAVELEKRVVGKAASMAVTALVGPRVARSTQGKILFGLGALLLGAIADEILARVCPKCGGMLEKFVPEE